MVKRGKDRVWFNSAAQIWKWKPVALCILSMSNQWVWKYKSLKYMHMNYSVNHMSIKKMTLSRQQASYELDLSRSLEKHLRIKSLLGILISPKIPKTGIH